MKKAGNGDISGKLLGLEGKHPRGCRDYGALKAWARQRRVWDLWGFGLGAVEKEGRRAGKGKRRRGCKVFWGVLKVYLRGLGWGEWDGRMVLLEDLYIYLPTHEPLVYCLEIFHPLRCRWGFFEWAENLA